MIKFSGEDRNTGRPVLGIGLSRENCDRLLGGQSIQFTTDNMLGLPVLDIFIMAGETEESMTHDLLQAGAVTPGRIREDKSLRHPTVRPADIKGAN